MENVTLARLKPATAIRSASMTLGSMSVLSFYTKFSQTKTSLASSKLSRKRKNSPSSSIIFYFSFESIMETGK